MNFDITDMTDKIVELIRRSSPMSRHSKEWDFLISGPGQPQQWHEFGVRARYGPLSGNGASTLRAIVLIRRIATRSLRHFGIWTRSAHQKPGACWTDADPLLGVRHPQHRGQPPRESGGQRHRQYRSSRPGCQEMPFGLPAEAAGRSPGSKTLDHDSPF